MHRMGFQTINGTFYFNTGEQGRVVETVSQKRVIIAAVISGAVMMAGFSDYGRVAQVVAGLWGIIAGMELGKDCPVKEMGAIRDKVFPTRKDQEKEQTRKNIEEFYKKWRLDLLIHKPNPFKLIWPS